MTQFKKEDIKSKSTDELLKDFHESRFHHQDYISLVIEVLIARGLTRTILFEKKATQDLVDIISLNSDKHNDQYLRLILLELEHRQNDVNSIHDIKKLHNYSSINRKDNYFKSNKGILAVGIVVIFIVVIKLSLMSNRNNTNENNNQKANESINQREELQDFDQFRNKVILELFQTDGVLNQRLISIKSYLEKTIAEDKKITDQSFAELIQSERIEIIEILSKLDFESLNLDKIYGITGSTAALKREITVVYFRKFDEILDLYE
jgi:hypothetical protein